MYDCIIQNARVIDGTGAPAFQADIALKNGKIARVAAHLQDDCFVIDAAGLTVTPGFIDSHSHSDGVMLTAPDQLEKIEQGITLSIGGQCGSTAAPMDKDPTADMLGDLPGYGKKTDVYKTMGTLLEIAKDVPQGASIATYVGHRALRRAAMNFDNRRPDEKELQVMKDLLAEAMAHGAMGVSFGLIYAPSCYAQTDELIELAKVAATHGGMVSAHIRNEREQVIEATAEFIEILRRSGARGVLSHHKAAGRENWGKVNETLRMIDEAVAEGIDIYLDVYPYTASSTKLSATLVPKEWHALGAEGIVQYLSDAQTRRQIFEADMQRWGEDLSWILISKCPAYPQYEGKRLDEIAALHGTHVYDAVFDMIRDSKDMCTACFFTMCEEDVKKVLAHPRAMICTDSSVAGKATSYHPRLRGTFPRVLGRYVREMQVTAPEEMIRKMTSLPAMVYDLKGKGRIAEGYDADLCIFDAQTIIDRADYAACHLHAEGLRYVLVNGEIVVENAVFNGKRRGKVLLRGR